MSETIAVFNQLRDVSWFLPDTRERATEGGLTKAMADELDAANIHIDVRGDVTGWENPGQPVLAVGDHSRGLESLLILGALGVVGRGNVSVTAKPYALTGQVINALSQDDDEYLIGVIPGNMARERTGGDFGTRVHRALFKRHLLSQDGTRAYNARALDTAADALARRRRIVTVFPTGGVYNAATTPWRSGVGQIATRLSPEAFADTAVVPFMFDGINPRRIMQAVAARRLGFKPRPQEISIRFGEQQTLGDIFSDSSQITAETITDVLYHRYRGEFLQAEHTLAT